MNPRNNKGYPTQSLLSPKSNVKQIQNKLILNTPTIMHDIKRLTALLSTRTQLLEKDQIIIKKAFKILKAYGNPKHQRIAIENTEYLEIISNFYTTYRKLVPLNPLGAIGEQTLQAIHASDVAEPNMGGTRVDPDVDPADLMIPKKIPHYDSDLELEEEKASAPPPNTPEHNDDAIEPSRKHGSKFKTSTLFNNNKKRRTKSEAEDLITAIETGDITKVLDIEAGTGLWTYKPVPLNTLGDTFFMHTLRQTINRAEIIAALLPKTLFSTTTMNQLLCSSNRNQFGESTLEIAIKHNSVEDLIQGVALAAINANKNPLTYTKIVQHHLAKANKVDLVIRVTRPI